MNYAKYLPIDPDFYEILDNLTTNHKELKIFYFLPDNEIGQANGKYKEIKKTEDGEFLTIKDGRRVRLDRIITINGKPGPAFDEYDSYANACLSCQAGYEV